MLRIGHVVGPLFLRPGLVGADIIRPLSPSLWSKLPYVSVLRTQASRRQATPGSSLPSMNSREAPPPVEMWVILSA